MAFMDRLRSLFGGDSSPEVVYTWSPLPETSAVLGMSPAEVWRQQPYLRTVVTFMARNIAQLGLHTFQRVGETDRERDRTGPLASLLRRPNATTTGYELVFGLVADLALYDTAYLVLGKSTAAPSGFELSRVPVPWVAQRGGDAFTYKTFRVQAPGAREYVDVDAEDVLVFHGWSPGSARDGAPPVEALKSILAEQIQAVRYREAVWKRGGKVSAVITRPGGHRWTDDQRNAFRADWNSKWTGSGSGVGGTPILEDGMTLNKVDFSAHEQEFVEGAKLALTTVASVYHVNPTMIGVLDNANYSNVREFRKMLYGDSLGPVIAMIEDRINTFLVPRVDARPGVYVEFNIAEKLQGSFEEQTTALQASVGRPWMTANEARARLNMPSLDEYADELVTPLNVLVGGQASPVDGETEGGVDLAPVSSTEEPDLESRVNALATLIRSGFDPADACRVVGLDPIIHLGLLPVTIQRPTEPDNVDEEAVEALKSDRKPAIRRVL